mmetsp:Transcript_33105/g.53353  ORF Transcript_33105/g.53353 Transcript_33105/m.53353 type:complete len:104 (+) Transcript_33105:366-677(+)
MEHVARISNSAIVNPPLFPKPSGPFFFLGPPFLESTSFHIIVSVHVIHLCVHTHVLFVSACARMSVCVCVCVRVCVRERERERANTKESEKEKERGREKKGER